MSIDSEAYKLHFVSNAEEREVAEVLGDSFDITFGRTSNDLSIWAAKAKPHIEGRFGFFYELLVVYSRHNHTDARVLKLISETLSNPKFASRLDPNVILLIHNGDAQRTEELCKEETKRILIPFTRSQILSPTKGSLFIRNKIADHTGKLDLFGQANPIYSDKHFFGRRSLVQEMYSRLTTKGENLGVFGLRKTGKTSVLAALERRFLDNQILSCYIDCHGPAVHNARWWKVLEYITCRLEAKYFDLLKRKARTRYPYTLENAGLSFSMDMQDLMVHESLKRIVIILDEIEYITPTISGPLSAHWDGDYNFFWQSIRSVCQESNGAISFIIAGVNPLCATAPRFNDMPNPIFQLVQPSYLDPFSRDSVREMVRSIGRLSQMTFDEDVYGYLQKRFGGHPFLIRIACSELWRSLIFSDDEKLVQVTVQDFVKIEQQIKSRLTQPVKDILLSLLWWYKEEYDVLRILADGDKDFVSSYIKAHPDSLLQFARYGLLEETSRDGFQIRDVQDFLRVHGGEYEKELNPFRRGDFPPEVLPTVPDIEELGKLFTKRTEVEVALRKLIVIVFAVEASFKPEGIAERLIEASRRPKGEPSVRELLQGRSYQDAMHQLYLNELKQIISNKWPSFKHIFDDNKTRFEMNMDTINKARQVDAHAKPFSIAERDEFHNSYGWMISKLSTLPNMN